MRKWLRVNRWISACWILFIVALSMAPLSFKDRVGTTGPLHDVGHLLAFLIAAVLFAWNTVTLRGRMQVGVAVLTLGFVLELAEKLIYRNMFEWHDVLMDGAGILLGLGLVGARMRFRPVQT